MWIVLISTYDLGRQPFGLASPAAWLRREGAMVHCCDLAVEPLDEDAIRDADLVAFHIPMHTATRLAARLVPRVRALNARAHLCFYGLYAAMNESWLRELGADTVLGGEFEAGLTHLARRLAAGRDGTRSVSGERESTLQVEPVLSLDRLAFIPPDRAGLPSLARYAKLETGLGARVVGATEASRGCKHLCRHCPIVPVYGGHFRIVPRDVVLEDVRRLVAAGAEHITFGDPDFFNGIGHAVPLVRALRAEHPTLTYDVTIKIEHLRRHDAHLATLRETGCLLVTSAVESVDDAVLARLDKGHTRADFLAVAHRCREEGLALQPTFVAFHPWLSLGDYRRLLAVLAEHDLVEHVPSIQLAIRLLLPRGSKLLELDDIASLSGAFDSAALVHPWRHPDPRVDALHQRVQSLVQSASACGHGRREIFARIWALAAAAGGGGARPEAPTTWTERAPVPYLTEPWYC
jgi:radical SAM superfamily enzyme YgiQ (UPF0313 family)